jgi:hypothetical protein
MSNILKSGFGSVGANTQHPRPMDLNKSIIWARYLIDSTDWLLFATRVTRVQGNGGALSTKVKLASMAVLAPTGKVLYEALLKPDEEISNHLIAEHGLDYSVVFNAKTFAEIVTDLNRLFEGRQALAWDLAAQQSLLDELCEQYRQPPVALTGFSMRPEYARFRGEMDEFGRSYKVKVLNVDGVGAAAEARALISALYTMASSSQITNTAPTGNQGWTGEFYRPKVTAKDKIKDFFGI